MVVGFERIGTENFHRFVWKSSHVIVDKAFQCLIETLMQLKYLVFSNEKL